MPASTAKQKRAACAAYGIGKRGGRPRAFASASQGQRREFCVGKVRSSRGRSPRGRR